MFLFLAILAVIGIIVIPIFRKQHEAKIASMRLKGKERQMDAETVDQLCAKEVFPFPSWSGKGLGGIAILSFVIWAWSFLFFYADPMYIYHIRTVFNQERVVSTLGWAYRGGGDYTPWKKAVTVQAAANTGASKTAQVAEDGKVSANLLPRNVVFLDNVDADASATARFRLPTDRETFLHLAHEYRTPANFLITALIPAFDETLQATASLMSAEEYFAGARTEFSIAFDNQMRNGIYQVKRRQTTVTDPTINDKASANAALGEDQKEYGDNDKVIFEVVKLENEDGTLKRKHQSFKDYGVSVIDARIPDMKPNTLFVGRMEKKQKASADRAIAIESRIQEVEQKLLVEAKGAREVAEKQADAKVFQIEQTTNAETTKQLALTVASQNKEQAAIDKQTAQLLLDKTNIDSKAIKVKADADAYARKKKILSDNGLKMKVEALVQMNKDNADAFAKRQVPATVVYSGGASKGQLGSSSDMNTVVTSQMLKNLKALDLDIGVKNP